MLDSKDDKIVEAASLKDLKEIERLSEEYRARLILIGGYAVRAYTGQGTWRFTKDMDFITVREDLSKLYNTCQSLGYEVRKAEFGIGGSKKINSYSIELHVSVDKVIDWSTDRHYPLPRDIFKRSKRIIIEPFFEENKDIAARAMVAPVEDVLIMKLMTEKTARPRDQFDSIALILDSYGRMNLARFAAVCEQSGLSQHITKQLELILADVKKGLIKKLWREFTGREFIRKQEVVLKERVKTLVAVLQVSL